MTKPLVYVAGPITGNPFGCVRQAIDAFAWLREAGCVPFLPQLSVLHEMVEPQSYEAWLAYDFDMLERCDALVRLPGASPGADREVEHARSLGIAVFSAGEPTEENVRWMTAYVARWVRDWQARQAKRPWWRRDSEYAEVLRSHLTAIAEAIGLDT